MKIAIIDWLGRGGIAQCSDSWAIVASELGAEAAVVTRSGRELHARSQVRFVGASPTEGRLAAHRAVVASAERLISDWRPDVVVVQNYVVPPLEWPVYRAAKRVDARLVVVVHDHRLHSLAAGVRTGLRRLLRGVDVIVTHSDYVRRSVAQYTARADVEVLALPVQLGMLSAAGPSDPARLPDGCVALHFGVVRRKYKGARTVIRLARAGIPGWSFVVAGAGAPSDPAVASFPGFLEPGRLVSLVSKADCVVLPYRMASQSGAVALAQAVGTVPIASAVGGIPEQITNGTTGLLIPARARLDVWVSAVARLGDAAERQRMADASRASAWARQAEFVDRVRSLVS